MNCAIFRRKKCDRNILRNLFFECLVGGGRDDGEGGAGAGEGGAGAGVHSPHPGHLS